MSPRAWIAIAVLAACRSRATSPACDEPGSAAIARDTLRGTFACGPHTCKDGELCKEVQCGHTCPPVDDLGRHPGYYSIVSHECIAAPAACPHDGGCACDGHPFCRVTGRDMLVMGY